MGEPTKRRRCSTTPGNSQSGSSRRTFASALGERPQAPRAAVVRRLEPGSRVIPPELDQGVDELLREEEVAHKLAVLSARAGVEEAAEDAQPP